MPIPPAPERTLGVVYTPPDVARAMAEVALGPLLRGRTAAQLLQLRVCDPAAGEGAFLAAAQDVLAAAVHAAWEAEGGEATLAAARAAVARCLVGVDVDPDALDRARGVLEPGVTLNVGDALVLDWRTEYAAVFAQGGFDVVLGNPPYIRQEWLGAAQKAVLREFDCYDAVADLYVYFVELAHRIVRPRGRFCLITPNKWMTAAYGRPLRTYLAEQASIEGIVDVSRLDVFADADAFPAITWGAVHRARETAPRAARLAPDAPFPARLDEIGDPHDRERWTTEPWHIDDPADRALLDQLAARWPTLAASIEGRPCRGVVTGYNRAFILDRAERDALLAVEPDAAALLRPFVKGRDLRRWLPQASERWILLVDRGTSIAHLPQVTAHLERFRSQLEPRPRDWSGAWRGRKPGAYQWYELQDPVSEPVRASAPRLLYQDIQAGPACCLDRDQLVPDTTVWILPTSDLFILAVLNSPLYGWYARRRFPPALGGAVRPKLEYMRMLPIAQPSETQRRAIDAGVLERIELEPRVRRGDAASAQRARDLDIALGHCVLDAYDVSAADRERVLRA